MATIHSPIRKFLKPLLFKLMGKKGYLRFQVFGKIKDIEQQNLDEAEMELYPDLLSSDACILDIGANYAYHTHRFAQLAPQGRILAFEPVPFTFQVLKRVCSHYKLKGVELFEKGIGAKNETVVFELPLQDFGVISAGQSHMTGRSNDLEGKEQHYKFTSYEEVECEVIALDDFDLKLKRLDFIKMDIEGAEFFALKGMKKTCSKFKPPILIEINPFFLKGFSIEESDFKALIKDMAYECYLYDAEQKKLRRFEDNYFESNYFLLHKDRLEEYKAIIKSN